MNDKCFLESQAEISIIVPVYNVPEHYLRYCIDSLINQTEKSIQIILVDDGSLDNSGSICDAYAEQDSRVKVIHKKNQGVSQARNIGISEASGKWVIFVDADDWLDLDACEKLLGNKEIKDYDIVLFSLFNSYANKEIRYSFFNNNDTCERLIVDSKDLQKDCLTTKKPGFGYGVGCVCGKMYKRLFLNKNYLYFATELPLSEDTMFLLWALEYTDKAIVLNQTLYHYRFRIGNSGTSYDVNVKSYDNALWENLSVFFESTEKQDDFLQVCYEHIVLCCIPRSLNKNILNPKAPKYNIHKIKAYLDQKPYNVALANTNIRGTNLKNKIKIFLLKYRFLRLYIIAEKIYWKIGRRSNIDYN